MPLNTSDVSNSGQVVHLQPNDSSLPRGKVSTKDKEGAPIGVRQAKDPQLTMIMRYLETGELTTEEKQAKELILGKTRNTLINGILYHLGIDQSLQIVLPRQDRYCVFKEVHQGKFAGHL